MDDPRCSFKFPAMSISWLTLNAKYDSLGTVHFDVWDEATHAQKIMQTANSIRHQEGGDGRDG